MIRRTITIFLINGLLLLLATPLFAGGWAVVTVDDLPQHLRTGEVTTLGFTVRQHGQHGVNLADVLARATDPTSGETLTFPARQEGAVGHYVVEILLPTAGVWNWEIQPGWFPPVTLAPVSVVDQTVAHTETRHDPTVLDSVLPWVLTGTVAVIRSRDFFSPYRAAHSFPVTAGLMSGIALVGGLDRSPLATHFPTTAATQPAATADYGRALFMAKGCNSCHLHDQALNQWSTEMGPNLTHYANTSEYLYQWLKDPQSLKPNTEMPNMALKVYEIEALTAFLLPTKE